MPVCLPSSEQRMGAAWVGELVKELAARGVRPGRMWPVGQAREGETQTGLRCLELRGLISCHNGMWPLSP